MPSAIRTTLGFTLVELVTTIVLIGILGAVAVPRFVDSDNAFAERGYADEIASSLRYARNVAIASECGVRVTVNVASYDVEQRTDLNSCNNAGSAWNTTVRRGDGTAVAGMAPSSVTVASPTTIVFDRNGRIAAPELIQIGPFTISVDAASGFVSVQT